MKRLFTWQILARERGRGFFSSLAKKAEMSGEYERRERILHIPFVFLFSPGNDSTFTSQPFFDPFRRLKSFFSLRHHAHVP